MYHEIMTKQKHRIHNVNIKTHNVRKGMRLKQPPTSFLRRPKHMKKRYNLENSGSAVKKICSHPSSKYINAYLKLIKTGLMSKPERSIKKNTRTYLTIGSHYNDGFGDLELCQSNNIVTIRPILTGPKAFVLPQTATIRNNEQTKSTKEQVDFKINTASNQEDGNKLEPNHRTPDKIKSDNTETIVILREDEKACEVARDDDPCAQLQNSQENVDMNFLVEDDVDSSHRHDEFTECLPQNGETEESMAQLKDIDNLEDEENLEEKLTEKSDVFAETEEKIYILLDELKTNLKFSAGLRMITPEAQLKTLFNGFLCKQNKKQLRKNLLDPSYLRLRKNSLTVNAVRSNGHVLVIPHCMVHEFRRLLSLSILQIESHQPILMLLARDGFFSDYSGIVCCCFCGQLIQNILFESHHHDQLVFFLECHRNTCDRRNNIPFENYGSNVNLADLMAGMNQMTIVPSGCYYRIGRTRFCQEAIWIHVNSQNIAPTGMRLPQAQSSLPPPDLVTTSSNIPAVPPQNRSQVLIGTNLSAPLSSVNQQAVTVSASAASSNEAEGESQQQSEEMEHLLVETEGIAYEVNVRGEALNTENTVRAELSSEANLQDNQVEENTHIDIERELPLLNLEENDRTLNKTRPNNVVIENTDQPVTADNLTGAEAAVGIQVPNMADFDDRIATFSSCKMCQTPQALAKSGLFYTGDADKVCCFTCGGCLEQWEESDDPLLEHARNYPKCEFIWSIVIDMQMNDDPMFLKVVDNFVLSPEGQAAVEQGFTHRQISAAIERLVITRERITCENIIAKLNDMNETPRP